VQPILDGRCFELVGRGPDRIVAPPEIGKGVTMGTFITAYAIVWLALVLYIVRLRTNQRRLERLVRSLQSRIQDSHVRAQTGSHVGMEA
jgi:CcmD family protein